MTATETTRPTVQKLIEQFDAYWTNPDLMRHRQRELDDEALGEETKDEMTAAAAHAAVDRREWLETQKVRCWLIAGRPSTRSSTT